MAPCAPKAPIVLHPVELASLVQHCIHRIEGFLHLIVCHSQQEFIGQLLASINHENQLAIQEAESSGIAPRKIARFAQRKHDLFVPTLRQLANTEKVKVTFCETLMQLQAYLSVYYVDLMADQTSTMVLVNPVAVHRNISSFSAQGLGRTFASAVDAATRTRAQLIIAECPMRAPAVIMDRTLDSDEPIRDIEGVRNALHGDLWDEEISILNVATKSFGAGERGWVGRTVKIRSVVERWCVFERPFA